LAPGNLNLLDGHFEDQKQRSKANNSLDYFPFTHDINWLSWSDPVETAENPAKWIITSFKYPALFNGVIQLMS
jgi:hypothetical protein